jgi:hypothetical protein
MHFRAAEYQQLSVNARWLEPAKAQNAYHFALRFCSSERYGLNDKTVQSIEHHEIESYAVADAWLKSRIPSVGALQVAYSESEVCVVEAADLLANWQSIFVPARDDAIVLHNLQPVVFFYCHEEELQVGQRVA